MKVVVVCVVLLFACACVVRVGAADPKRPKISEVFQTSVTLNVTVTNSSSEIKGDYRVDQPAGKSYLAGVRSPGNEHLIYVERYDIERSFDVDGTKCHTAATKGKMEPLFGFTETAKYNGTKTEAGKKLNLWSQVQPEGLTETVAVLADSVDTPVWYRVESKGLLLAYTFEDFKARAQESKWFEIPKECRSHLEMQ
eukprot:TRINITY_DN5072_c1_g1_i1.p1 TRINITY_DN5072_c1_g1~~TRINITY_DN5072_c1_g1_i1.p1  ORF type:complete len:196 (+),score=39.75 TRINITY_DN5072_c1_g1_i1:20-607(+)